MREKPLIVMALESEGQGLIEKLGYEVLYCGVGKVNAAYYLTRRLHKPATGNSFSYILNLGSAGSPSFPTGSLIAADRFVQRDMDATGLGFVWGETPFDKESPLIQFPKRFKHLQHGVCASGDSFLQGPCPVPCEIIDMEGYALAKICMRESIPFACVKYITDGADKNASIDWNVNLKLIAEAFMDLLEQHSVTA